MVESSRCLYRVTGVLVVSSCRPTRKPSIIKRSGEEGLRSAAIPRPSLNPSTGSFELPFLSSFIQNEPIPWQPVWSTPANSSPVCVSPSDSRLAASWISFSVTTQQPNLRHGWPNVTKLRGSLVWAPLAPFRLDCAMGRRQQKVLLCTDCDWCRSMGNPDPGCEDWRHSWAGSRTPVRYASSSAHHPSRRFADCEAPGRYYGAHLDGRSKGRGWADWRSRYWCKFFAMPKS